MISDLISTPRDWALGSESYDEVRDLITKTSNFAFGFLTAAALVSSISMHCMYPAKCAL